MNVTFQQEDNCYVFNCPHCDSLIQVEKNQVNCTIFRHGQYKSTGEQIPPHSSKEICDSLVKQNLIYGCGKPFKLLLDSNNIVSHAEICDYI